jgi:hypothetical protein
MADLLITMVDGGDWLGTVTVLFGPNPLFSEYYHACITQDLEKAKKELEKGAFAEQTFLWYCGKRCRCGLNGCYKFVRPVEICLRKNHRPKIHNLIQPQHSFFNLPIKRCQRR